MRDSTEFDNEESANPNISPTGLPQPIYSYVKSALCAYLNWNIMLLVFLLARWKFVGEIEQINLAFPREHNAKVQNFLYTQ